MTRYIVIFFFLFLASVDVVSAATYSETFDASSGNGANTIFTIRTGRFGANPSVEGASCFSPSICMKTSTNFGALGVWAFVPPLTPSGRISMQVRAESNASDFWFYFAGAERAIYDASAGVFGLTTGGTDAPISLAQNVWHDLELQYRAHSSGFFELAVCADDACSGFTLTSIAVATSTTVGFTGTGGGTGASEIWADNFFMATDLAPDWEFPLFSGTTTDIVSINSPAPNLMGVTTTVLFDFDYIVGSNFLPTFAGIELVRFAPTGFHFAAIEEPVTASGLSNFSELFDMTNEFILHGVGFYRWRAYLRDDFGNREVLSSWRNFTNSTTTSPTDPGILSSWDEFYGYASSSVTTGDGYISEAYARCSQFDDWIFGFVSTPICKFFVFLIVPQNVSVWAAELRASFFTRIPFSYVASVTDTVTAARSEYYSSSPNFPEFTLDLGTSSALDISFAVLSKDNIEAIAGANTIPQFRIIMEYFLWLSFLVYAFFVSLSEVKRLVS